MVSRIRQRTRSNVIAFAALFFALVGGTAQAAVAPENSVVSKSIVDGQVKTPDLAKASVTNAKIATGAVNAPKVAPDSLGGGQIRELALDVKVLQRRIASACPPGQAIRAVTSTGGVVCQGSSGTVTSVDSGTGLTGGPITSAGTLSIASPFRLPQGCTNGQVAKADGSGSWNCAADQDSPTGAAGGALSGTYPNPSLNVSGGPCPNGQALTNVSASAALTCDPGLYSDAAMNVGAGASFPALTTGASNSALGWHALAGNTAGVRNSAVGKQALNANTTGTDNSAFGDVALLSNTTGNENSGLGESALFSNSTGNANTAVGYQALSNSTTASNNSALGANALLSNTTGGANTAVGQDALDASTTASDNSALGKDALGADTTGAENSAFGKEALGANTTASFNAAFGWRALASNTTGTTNTALGTLALEYNSTGTNNLAVGTNALEFGNSDNNTAVGSGALDNGAGNNNIALGYWAGVNQNGTGDNNIYVGNRGANESNTIRIGTAGTQTRAFVAGIRGTTTGAGDAVPVLIDSNGQLGTASSSRRVKRDIHPLGSMRALMKLRPVSFRYRHGPPELHYGLIAEQVAKVLPTLAVDGKDGRPETVQYQELPALLLAKVQSQQRQLDREQAQNARQQEQIRRLMRRVSRR